MFYIIVGLWVVACFATYGLKNLRHGLLVRSCPCVATSGILLAAVLYSAGEFIVSYIVLAAAVYLTFLLLWSLKLQHDTPHS